MDTEHLISRIKDEIIAASAAIEEPEGSDFIADGKRLAYTNALAVILDVYTNEYLGKTDVVESCKPKE